MEIYNKAFHKLKHGIDMRCDYEIGGILGSVDGVVCDVFVDDRRLGNTHCTYIPDVFLLNTVLDNWMENERYQFAGLFHTHFREGMLSYQDRNYIHNIMECMPLMIKELYFPIIVLPKFEILVYKAIKSEDSVYVRLDTLNVVDK